MSFWKAWNLRDTKEIREDNHSLHEQKGESLKLFDLMLNNSHLQFKKIVIYLVKLYYEQFMMLVYLIASTEKMKSSRIKLLSLESKRKIKKDEKESKNH